MRKPDDVGLPDPVKPLAPAVKKFEEQITRRAKKLDLHELTDDYTERLEKLAAQKEKKKADIVRAPVESEEEEEKGGEVIDLMAVLSRSLGKSARASAPKRKPARKAGAKRAAASKKRAAR